MKFKDERCRTEFYQAPTLLQVICSDFEALSHAEGIDPLVTRVRESVTGSSGVHEWGRAVDFRDEHDGKFLYSSEAKARIARELNARYARSDQKPTLLWHSFAGGPLHGHVQMALNPKVYERGKEAPQITVHAALLTEETQVEKAYDLKALADKLKARGLELAEDGAKGVVEDVFAFLEESAKLSSTPFDDMALIILPKVKEMLLGAVDKIDGQVG